MKYTTGRDTNGNKTVKVKCGSSNAFSIQTNHNCPETHSNGITEATAKEVYSYVEKCGTDRQKNLLDIQIFEYPLFWKDEEIDTGNDRQDAVYLRNEYNIAYNGGVSIGTRRRV